MCICTYKCMGKCAYHSGIAIRVNAFVHSRISQIHSTTDPTTTVSLDLFL